MGSRALSVESAEEGAELAEEGAVGGVNLSDFCRYYQQPTNNTPELALRIGSSNKQYAGVRTPDRQRAISNAEVRNAAIVSPAK